MRSGPPILRAGMACAKPLMSDDDHAEALFVAALSDESREYPFLRARTLFSFGRWLRRQRRSPRLARTPTPSDQPLRSLGSDSLE